MIGMSARQRYPRDRRKTLGYDVQRDKDCRSGKVKVSDPVRVSKYKTVFEKSYTPNWTTEVFKIVKIQHTNFVTYLLEDYCGKSLLACSNCIARLTRTCISWRKYYARRVTRFMWSGWDSMGHTILGYTRTMWFNIDCISIKCFFILNI